MTKIPLPYEQTELRTWFERDRAHVHLLDSRTDETIVEWWDEEVAQAVEDGFLNHRAFICGRLLRPKPLHQSAYEYAADHGLLPQTESEVA